VLPTPPQLCCPPLDTLQGLDVILTVRGPKLNTVPEVQPYQHCVQGTITSVLLLATLFLIQYLYLYYLGFASVCTMLPVRNQNVNVQEWIQTRALLQTPAEKHKVRGHQRRPLFGQQHTSLTHSGSVCQGPIPNEYTFCCLEVFYKTTLLFFPPVYESSLLNWESPQVRQ